ncbi:hypothetical protein MSAN_00240300 [Mycena sanguinolenta]|uniref:Uncharacterized protein n=1 Tax=Mycena sanguinolenta TaxID=230812 RepID=A0A8H6ZFQ7_9AGAR|nr:hypothetical protein MSAN_00240300 [Mycena sanguinolenta]
MAPALFSSVYEYIFGGVVGVVALAILLLCVRARIAERNRPRVFYFDELTEKPILYDIHLDLETGLGNGDESGVWGEIMPVSLHPIDPSPPLTTPPPKNAASIDPPMSALSTVAVMIAMPSPTVQPSQHDPNDDLDDDVILPYVEFGAADVEVPREIPQSSPTIKSKNKRRSRAA